MSVRFEIEPVDYYCQHCDSAMEYTACEAPGCSQYRCLNCRAGCDLEELDDGWCAVTISTMTYAQRLAAQEERHLRREHRRPVRTVNLP